MAKKRRFRDIKNGKVEVEESIVEEVDTTPYASTLTKFKAFTTDLFMLLMPILYIVIYLVMGGREGFATSMLEGWIYVLIPNFIVVFLFFWRSGQTPGCRAYDIELVDMKSLAKPHPLAIVLRYYFEIISIFLLFGVVMMFFRRDHLGLHDLLSGTILIEKK